jgi:hypothetical protein
MVTFRFAKRGVLKRMIRIRNFSLFLNPNPFIIYASATLAGPEAAFTTIENLVQVAGVLGLAR